MARTVKVVRSDGTPMNIAEWNYDPAVHVRWEDRESLDPPEPEPAAPTDPDERLAAIKEAIGQLDPENPEHFTKGGDPKVEAIEAILGYNISAGERDEVWESLQGE